MMLAARWLAARGESEIRIWLDNNPDLIGSLLSNEEFQRSALSHAVSEATAEERSCLRLLAFSRRALSRDEWENLTRQDPENIHQFDQAILGLVERSLVQKNTAAYFRMHNLVAETVIRSASDDERIRAYRALDAGRGMQIYMPQSRNASYYEDY